MSDARVGHAPITHFKVVDDCLQIGGIPLTELVERVGRTPFYAYDRKVISDRVELLRAHLPRAVQLHYAIKANPMPDVVQHLARLVDGLDVASAGELKIALASGMNPAEISFAGPGKTDVELAEALAAGILVNLESEGERERLAGFPIGTGVPPGVAAGVNQALELKSWAIKMG